MMKKTSSSSIILFIVVAIIAAFCFASCASKTSKMLPFNMGTKEEKIVDTCRKKHFVALTKTQSVVLGTYGESKSFGYKQDNCPFFEGKQINVIYCVTEKYGLAAVIYELVPEDIGESVEDNLEALVQYLNHNLEVETEFGKDPKYDSYSGRRGQWAKDGIIVRINESFSCCTVTFYDSTIPVQ